MGGKHLQILTQLSMVFTKPVHGRKFKCIAKFAGITDNLTLHSNISFTKGVNLLMLGMNTLLFS